MRWAILCAAGFSIFTTASIDGAAPRTATRRVSPLMPPVITAAFDQHEVVRGNAPGGTVVVHIRVFNDFGEVIQDAKGFVAPSGQFAVGLLKPLGSGQIVQAYAVRNDVDAAPSSPVIVRAAQSPHQAPPSAAHAGKTDTAESEEPSGSASRPGAHQGAANGSCDTSDEDAVSIDALAQGATKVSGTAVVPSGLAMVCLNGVPVRPGDEGAKGLWLAFERHHFAVSLSDPLLANQRVVVVVRSDDRRAAAAVSVHGDLCAGGPSDPVKPPEIGTPRSGDTHISGSVGFTTGKILVCVNGAVADISGSTGRTTAVSDSKFDLQLAKALPDKGSVRVIATSDKDERVWSDTPIATSCSKPAGVFFTRSPKEGDTIVYGAGVPSTESSKCAVSVLVNGDQVSLLDNKGNENTSVTADSAGFFSATLKQSLEAGQCVTVVQYDSGGQPDRQVFRDAPCQAIEPHAAEKQESPLNPAEAKPAAATQFVRSFLDFGRVRSYFAAGVVLSNSGTDFTRQDLFLSFDMDKNWLWGGPSAAYTGNGEFGYAGKNYGERAPYKRLMFNTFFEARLTAIPAIAGCSSPEAKNLPQCQPKTGTADSASTTPNSTLDTFLTTRKAATLLGGAYMPLVVSTWTHHRDPNALSIGPIAKIGFETPIDAVDLDGNTISPLTPKSFYVFYGYGARMGVHRMSYDRNVAPELLSYFDVIVGRFSNMDLDPLLPNPACPPGQIATGCSRYLRYSRPWRLGFEGLLKVPSVPFVLGMSANVRQNFGLGDSKTVDNQRDDLRFFIGTRFDFGRVAGKLKTLQ